VLAKAGPVGKQPSRAARFGVAAPQTRLYALRSIWAPSLPPPARLQRVARRFSATP